MRVKYIPFPQVSKCHCLPFSLPF
uniref:Uncharacterized protein n=1 Tax=Anguilla anguilla TaxID=7936 RepID=A0A0E9V9R3_ANGAN